MSNWNAWYAKNREKVNETRREKYATDSEHRDRRRNKAKQSMRKSRAERGSGWKQTASKFQVKEADLQKWCEAGLFPAAPDSAFNPTQVLLVGAVVAAVKKYGINHIKTADASALAYGNWSD